MLGKKMEARFRAHFALNNRAEKSATKAFGEHGRIETRAAVHVLNEAVANLSMSG
jgi:hypothetical protein